MENMKIIGLLLITLGLITLFYRKEIPKCKGITAVEYLKEEFGITITRSIGMTDDEWERMNCACRNELLTKKGR